ncbi:hypothetical protein Tco_0680677 [Tanacetum coccineum]|uniref:Uncharacterized protein n=1 Tax=Tanacetum coccineum TaxID=301880 RepID=A0ABQ4XMB9_9ASTR
MACIEEIAKDAKFIKNKDQLLVLIRRRVETGLMLKEKFRDLCEEASKFVKESEDVVQEPERLSGNDVAKETVSLLRRRQKRDLYKMTRLQMMVNESHLSVREKHTFVSKINLGTLDELAVAANSRGLFNGMLVYFDREYGKDVDFANGLHNLWAELLEHTNERQLFITELEGLCPSVMTYKILKFLNKVQKHDLIQLLELRKMIIGTYRQIIANIQLGNFLDTWTIKSICFTVGLEAAGNSNNLTDAMSVYIQREINANLQFAVGLSQPWDTLYIKVTEIVMLSSELNVFGGPLAVQCAEFLK